MKDFPNKYSVSIILPVYNGSCLITRAILSVRNQSYQDWELLIIDDGSTDSTELVVKDFLKDTRVWYLKNETNLGIQKTLNRGLQEARGKYIARIDADDLWGDEDKLLKQVEFLEANHEHVLIGSGATLINNKGEVLSSYLLPQSDEAIRNKILGKNCFVHSSVLFKKEALLKTGVYSEREEIRHIEDHELWLRLGTVGRFANIGKSMVTLTVSDQSITSKNRLVQARRMIKQAYFFKKKYPNFIKGIIVCYARLIFFSLLTVIPISTTVLYKIQSLVKGI